MPIRPGLRRHDWPLRDPKGLPLDEVREVRKVRDEVRQRVVDLIGREQLD